MRLVTAEKSISAQAFSRSLELFLSLLLFVATAVQHGNSYELAAANLIASFQRWRATKLRSKAQGRSHQCASRLRWETR